MQNQLSTANPDLASLPATGYLLESPPPPDPIDPPDNQGGGGGTGGTGGTTSEPDPGATEEAPDQQQVS